MEFPQLFILLGINGVVQPCLGHAGHGHITATNQASCTGPLCWYNTCSGFLCDTGLCISRTWLCDVEPDCPGGEDEERCSDQCPSDFVCDDGKCFTRSWACDGMTDCPGGEDEWRCTSPPAASTTTRRSTNTTPQPTTARTSLSTSARPSTLTSTQTASTQPTPKLTTTQPTTTQPVPTKICPPSSRSPGYLYEYGEKCFQFILVEKSWNEAKEYCYSKGAALMNLESRSKQLWAQGILTNELQSVFDKNGFWLGLHDRRVENVWYWDEGPGVPDVRAVNYLNWAAGEPNDLLNQDCVYMRRGYGWRWVDVGCNRGFGSRSYAFACEHKKIDG